jgi:hypothetical protein
MRSIGYVYSSREVARISELLESHGIAVFAEAIGGGLHAMEWCLFVCVASQYDDAMALLADPSHDVVPPIDQQEFERNARHRTAGPIRNGLSIALGLVALIALAVALDFVFFR